MNIKNQPHVDVIVIGAGAAGLMAAAIAALRGRRVILLEKNRKLGVKILMSGGTRCNITHHCDARNIAEAFGRQGKFLLSPLSALGPTDVVKLFNDLGVETKVESTEKIFPVSNKAIDVRDALVDYATEAGATILNEQAVSKISKTENQFCVSTSDSTYTCDHLVITTGGKSYPGCGTTGDGYAWAKQFGHTIVDTFPALTPLLCNRDWANALKGVTIENTVVKIWEPQLDRKKRKPIATNEGSFLFTHFGFSGPAPMNASRVVSGNKHKTKLQLTCDWLPNLKLAETVSELREASLRDGKQTISNMFKDRLPKRLWEQLVIDSGVDLQCRNAELSNAQIDALANKIKSTVFPIQGTLGFEKAEVTAGGVSLNEVSSQTMESKIVSGLFFAGEILDLDGPIGGYNFQSAFSTGFVAGENA